MQVFRFRLPLKRPIKIGSLTLTHREGLVLHQNGIWSEASPLPGFSPETLADVMLELSEPNLDDGPIRSPSLRFAVDSLRPLPINRSTLTDRIPVNALLQGTPSEIKTKAASVAAEGFRSVKLKVGRLPVEDDIRLVRDVRDALSSPSINIRLDANRAWDLETAVRFANATADCHVQYIEEPLRDASKLETFHDETGTPYALDETLQEDVSLDEFPHAAALVVKPTILGGRERITALAATGKPLVFSACYESGIGVGQIARLAAEFSPDQAAGLDTYDWLADDILRDRLPFGGGMLAVPQSADVTTERLKTEHLQEIRHA